MTQAAQPHQATCGSRIWDPSTKGISMKRTVEDSNYLIGARVKRCPKSFTNFLHSRFELLALEEDDEHGLVNLVSAEKRVFEWIFNFGLAEEYISTAGAPQHPLEGWQPFSEDDSGNKAELKAAALQTAALFRKELLMLA